MNISPALEPSSYRRPARTIPHAFATVTVTLVNAKPSTAPRVIGILLAATGTCRGKPAGDSEVSHVPLSIRRP
jgi:hypothetical protein